MKERESVGPVERTRGGRSRAFRMGVLLLAGALLALMLWLYGADLWALARDETLLRSRVAELGWRGPVALVLVNIIQIVVAPLPGYGLYIVAGFLYGTLWGGIWGSLGLLLGGMSAMALARMLGRPLVTRLVAERQLARWDRVTGTDNTMVWGLLMLSPVGDTPFLLAGLARVSFIKILILTILMRVPAAFAAAALGAGALDLSPTELALLGALLALPLLLYYRYRTALHGWFEGLTARHLDP